MSSSTPSASQGKKRVAPTGSAPSVSLGHGGKIAKVVSGPAPQRLVLSVAQAMKVFPVGELHTRVDREEETPSGRPERDLVRSVCVGMFGVSLVIVSSPLL
jgi:hypothetical protein